MPAHVCQVLAALLQLASGHAACTPWPIHHQRHPRRPPKSAAKTRGCLQLEWPPTPTLCLVKLSLQYGMKPIMQHHSATLKPSMTTSVTLLLHVFPSAVTYAQVSAYQTVKFLPSSLLWPIVKSLGSKKPCPGMQHNFAVCISLLYVAIRFTALKCKLCFDRAKYRKGHQAIFSWGNLKNQVLKQLETVAAHGMITTRRLGLSWPFASRNFRMSAVVTWRSCWSA